MQNTSNENYTDHWTTYALCSAVDDPEIFFPMTYNQSAVFQIAEAKKVCERCVARVECLSWALRAGEPDGIWGGTTPDERRLMRKKLGIRHSERNNPAATPVIPVIPNSIPA